MKPLKRTSVMQGALPRGGTGGGLDGVVDPYV